MVRRKRRTRRVLVMAVILGGGGWVPLGFANKEMSMEEWVRTASYVEPHGHSPWHHERTGCLVPLERRHPAPIHGPFTHGWKPWPPGARVVRGTLVEKKAEEVRLSDGTVGAYWNGRLNIDGILTEGPPTPEISAIRWEPHEPDYQVGATGIWVLHWHRTDKRYIGDLVDPSGEKTVLGYIPKGKSSPLPSGPQQGPAPFSNLGFTWRADKNILIVATVNPSAAAEGKFEAGDEIRAVEGQTVATPRDFDARLAAFQMGARVKIDVMVKQTRIIRWLVIPKEGPSSISPGSRPVNRSSSTPRPGRVPMTFEPKLTTGPDQHLSYLNDQPFTGLQTQSQGEVRFAEYEYREGRVVRNARFHEHGQKLIESRWEPDGMTPVKMEGWYEGGQKRFEEIYEGGKPVSKKYWNERGAEIPAPPSERLPLDKSTAHPD